MKKLFAALALLLALVTVLSLVACGGTKQPDKNNVVDNNGDTNKGPDNSGNAQNPDNGGNTQNPDNSGNTQNPDNSGNTQNPDNGGNTQNPDNPPVVTPPEEIVFDDRNEVVFSLVTLTVRKAPDFDKGEILGYLTAGEGVTRIGYHKTYSKILFDHDDDEATEAVEAFVSTKYVTTESVSDDGFTLLDTPDTYYCSATATLNVRALPNYESNIVDVISRGDAVTRISYGESWTKITYTKTVEEDGEEEEVTVIGYVNSKYISANNPVTTKKFEKDGMSIVLGVDFKDITKDASGFTAAFDSEKASVAVIKETFATLEENEISTDMTLEEYAALILEANEFEAEVKTEDGLTYYVYTESSDEGDVVTYATFYKTDDAFWFFQFLTTAEDYETLSADFVTWAKSVTFAPAAE